VGRGIERQSGTSLMSNSAVGFEAIRVARLREGGGALATVGSGRLAMTMV